MSGLPVIGIVGLGTMGLGIAQVFAQAGFQVLASDAHTPARDSAKSRLEGALQSRVTAGKLSEADCAATLTRLRVIEDLADFVTAGMIIEAIVERVDAKRALFARLEPLVTPDCILATNTSSLPISKIAQDLTHPDRVLALHFFKDRKSVV